MTKAFVIKDICSPDSKQFAVVEHISVPIKGLKVWAWFEREADARALAHEMEYPE